MSAAISFGVNEITKNKIFTIVDRSMGRQCAVTLLSVSRKKREQEKTARLI